LKRPFFYGNNPVPIGKLPKPQLRFAAFLSRCHGISPLFTASGFFIFPGAVFCFLSRSSGIFFEIFGVKKDEPG
jgi:hypothetical protein